MIKANSRTKGSDLWGKPQVSCTKLIKAYHQAQMRQKAIPNTLLNQLNPQSWSSVDFLTFLRNEKLVLNKLKQAYNKLYEAYVSLREQRFKVFEACETNERYNGNLNNFI